MRWQSPYPERFKNRSKIKESTKRLGLWSPNLHYHNNDALNYFKNERVGFPSDLFSSYHFCFNKEKRDRDQNSIECQSNEIQWKRLYLLFHWPNNQIWLHFPYKFKKLQICCLLVHILAKWSWWNSDVITCDLLLHASNQGKADSTK